MGLIKYFEDEEFDQDGLPEVDEGCEFLNCLFKEIDLSKINLRSAKFIECKFEKCNLSNVGVTGSSWRETQFKECKLMGINWTSATTVASLSFYQTVLDYTVWQGLNLSGFIFKECSLVEVDFAQAKLAKSNFQNSNLAQTNFSGSDLTQADLRGATQYFIEPQYTKLRKAKLSMPEALVVLKALEIIID